MSRLTDVGCAAMRWLAVAMAGRGVQRTGPGAGRCLDDAGPARRRWAILSANPYTNPHLNPFLNPYMTQSNVGVRATPRSISSPRSRRIGGIGSGQIERRRGRGRPCAATARSPARSARRRLSDTPGAAGARLLQSESSDRLRGTDRYYNRHGTLLTRITVVDGRSSTFRLEVGRRSCRSKSCQDRSRSIGWIRSRTGWRSQDPRPR